MTQNNLPTQMEPRSPHNNDFISDNVLIEIIHAFKDILIEYIDKRYSNP